jgi:hypothetical protein
MLKEPYEEPERKGVEKLPPPKLKPLPKELKYRFLDDTNKYLVIISSKLIGEEELLMDVLKKFRKDFGYSMDDFKGISSSIATHRIFMEEAAQLVAEFSRRTKPSLNHDLYLTKQSASGTNPIFQQFPMLKVPKINLIMRPPGPTPSIEPAARGERTRGRAEFAEGPPVLTIVHRQQD